MQLDKRITGYGMTGFSALTLLLGAARYFSGDAIGAGRLWALGAAVVLAIATLDTISLALRRKVGLDLIALVSIGGAIFLQESLTASVIALMFSSGRALENFAEECARRDMEALLARAPQVAHRYVGSTIETVSLDLINAGDRQSVLAGEAVPVYGQLEKMAQVRTPFFDKTGTLTGGQAFLEEIRVGPSTDPQTSLALAASVEQF